MKAFFLQHIYDSVSAKLSLSSHNMEGKCRTCNSLLRWSAGAPKNPSERRVSICKSHPCQSLLDLLLSDKTRTCVLLKVTLLKPRHQACFNPVKAFTWLYLQIHISVASKPCLSCLPTIHAWRCWILPSGYGSSARSVSLRSERTHPQWNASLIRLLLTRQGESFMRLDLSCLLEYHYKIGAGTMR